MALCVSRYEKMDALEPTDISKSQPRFLSLSGFYSPRAACQCDPQGSLSGECEKVGGQCRCKANVMGRRCDQCAPGTYGFGVKGCTGESALCSVCHMTDAIYPKIRSVVK